MAEKGQQQSNWISSFIIWNYEVSYKVQKNTNLKTTAITQKLPSIIYLKSIKIFNSTLFPNAFLNLGMYWWPWEARGLSSNQQA